MNPPLQPGPLPKPRELHHYPLPHIHILNPTINMSEQVDLSTIPISPEGGNNPDGASSEEAGKTVTVFHDKDNFNVKHPLSSRWTLWFTKPASGKVESTLPQHSVTTALR